MRFNSSCGFDATGMAVAIFGEDEGFENYLVLESKEVNGCLYLMAEETEYTEHGCSDSVAEKYIFKFVVSGKSEGDFILLDSSHLDYENASKLFESSLA